MSERDKTTINKKEKIIQTLVMLADRFDKLNLKKEANFVDHLISYAHKPEDFDDGNNELLQNVPNLLDTDVVNVSAPAKHDDADELTDFISGGSPSRLSDIQRRHEIMKLKKMLEEQEELLEDEDRTQHDPESLLDKDDEELLEGLDDTENDFEDEHLDGKASDKHPQVRHMYCERCDERRSFHYNRAEGGWVCSTCENVFNYADDDLLNKKLKEDEPGTMEKVMGFLKENPEVLEKLLLFLI